jgi:hypothetical protein
VASGARRYGAVVPSNSRPERQRFSETIRLPRANLVPWIVFDCVFALLSAWLWAVATMTSGQRFFTALLLAATAVFLFGGASWFVAMHVVVDDRELTRRVGHRLAHIALGDIATVNVEGTTQPGLDRVVLILRDGSEQKVLTRRVEEMVAVLGGPRPPTRIDPNR